MVTLVTITNLLVNRKDFFRLTAVILINKKIYVFQVSSICTRQPLSILGGEGLL